ncbi:MAG: hypothetical protein ACTS3F_11655 [Phycisphaerales bacterium]
MGHAPRVVILIAFVLAHTLGLGLGASGPLWASIGAGGVCGCGTHSAVLGVPDTQSMCCASRHGAGASATLAVAPCCELAALAHRGQRTDGCVRAGCECSSCAGGSCQGCLCGCNSAPSDPPAIPGAQNTPRLPALVASTRALPVPRAVDQAARVRAIPQPIPFLSLAGIDAQAFLTIRRT